MTHTMKGTTRRHRRITTFDRVNIIILVILSLLFLYPIVVTISTSISDPSVMLSSTVYLLPYGFSLEAYKTLLERSNILQYYLNTILYAFGGTAIHLFCTSLMAYPLTFRDFRGKKTITVLLTITMFFSGGLVPSYINILNLGLRDTYWAIVLPGAISAYEVFVFRTFFSEIPSSLAESAYIDGAGHFRTLFSIILPLSKALLATFALFAIVRYWNDYMSALLYLDFSSKHPIQLFLRKILNTMRMDDIKDYAMLQELNKINSRTVQNAAIVITIVPILCVYPFLQKYFAQGVLVGSIKG